MSDEAATQIQGEQDPAAASPARGAAVDVERLAEKVYRLMLAETRLALGRGQSAPDRAGRRYRAR